MTYKIIKDAFGKVKHWYINENEFVFDGVNYEKDEYTGRCYYLEESRCLRADCDGKLVKRRISAKEYAELLEKCKAECTEPEVEENNTVSFTFEELEEERKENDALFFLGERSYEYWLSIEHAAIEAEKKLVKNFKL